MEPRKTIRTIDAEKFCYLCNCKENLEEKLNEIERMLENPEENIGILRIDFKATKNEGDNPRILAGTYAYSWDIDGEKWQKEILNTMKSVIEGKIQEIEKEMEDLTRKTEEE